MSEPIEETSNTDSNDEESGDGVFDNYDDLVDCLSSLEDTNSLFQSVDQSHNDCMFFMGSLQHACHIALEAPAIKERRPVLVYVHNDESLCKQKFYETMLCSPIVIDYLNMNYVVWPWDVSSEFNRYTLTKIWEQMFSVQFFDEFSIEECPLLIAVIRSFEYKTNEGLASEYQYKLLVKGYTLADTQVAINHNNLLNQLGIFKEECDKSEQNLAFNFVEKTGLSWEILFEITQYLSLNDALQAFSPNILPLLNRFQLKFHLSNPFDPLIKTIYPKIKSERIVSLHFNTNRLLTTTELNFLFKLKNVTSAAITLQHSRYLDQIKQYIEYLEKLTRLSLYYEDNLTDRMLNDILKEIEHKIKRLEIHCPRVACFERSMYQSNTLGTISPMIRYFLIDMSPFHPPSNYRSIQNYDRHFHMSSDYFIRMQNIQHIHLIINKCDLEFLLDADQWRMVINRCYQLKKIQLQSLGGAGQDEFYLKKNALETEKILRIVRPTIQFQISFI